MLHISLLLGSLQLLRNTSTFFVDVFVSGSGKLWKALLQRREFFSCSLLLAGKKHLYDNVEKL